MNPKYLSRLWCDYNESSVSRIIHPNDVMYNSSLKDEDYYYCGESALSVISAALLNSRISSVRNILDFSSGYGRVTRFLRAFFPAAHLTCSEVEEEAAKWCAQNFNASNIVTSKDVDLVAIDEKFDMIWLGSVFTHMDYERIKTLLKKLYGCLKPNGVIIASFRGEKMYQTYLSNPDLHNRDKDLVVEYEKTGRAYKRYPGWKDDWGLSLISTHFLHALGNDLPDSRMIMHGEVVWASAHDVLAWTNQKPKTLIR